MLHPVEIKLHAVLLPKDNIRWLVTHLRGYVTDDAEHGDTLLRAEAVLDLFEPKKPGVA